MFNFSEKFLNEYLPTTIELGRSFVTLEYQSTRRDSKGLFALDNLWDGLGALTVVMPNVKYFFGKVTMYPSYIRKGRDMILYFLRKHFACRKPTTKNTASLRPPSKKPSAISSAFRKKWQRQKKRWKKTRSP